MKQQIRRNLFETNSSSVHSIVITKESLSDIPESLCITRKEFGWENRTYSDIEDRVSYLYTGILECFKNDEQERYINKLIEFLEKFEIEVEIDHDNDSDWYGIDHVYELTDFIKDIFNDEDYLFNYLFSPTSYIMTGNDNEDPNPYDDEVPDNTIYHFIKSN